MGQSEVKFVGHALTSEGLKPDEEKTHAIIKMNPPKDRTEVLRFLGMKTYLSRYLPNLATEAENLRKLTRENVDWQWTDKEEKEFERIKKMVATITMQKYLDVNEPVTLECDASSTRLGAAIFQKNMAVGYASRILTRTVRKYAQTEEELPLIVFGCTKFD